MIKKSEYNGYLGAVLGSTNTGKTHYAIERMMSHRSGVIGFPLRLLARENYDKLVELKGKSQVALVTGEEKIVPQGARYFMCTTESMPLSKSFDFVGVDEIQLCADPERGHIFTDRLLRARGVKETLFMGAETMRSIIGHLLPEAEITTRERFSTLSYRGFKKLTRLPKRSAIVAFSMDDVYQIAELVKRQRGGTAVVLGALSPRTRNQQVEMYQSGEVDFLVATDAIGMGLNMDIGHVAFAGTRKYDGKHMRELTRAELGQVAGRAGRYKRDGSFGVTGRVRGIDSDDVEAIQQHQYKPVDHIFWRNSDLDFTSPHALMRSLDSPANSDVLSRGRIGDDVTALSGLMRSEDIMARASGGAATRMLWDVCQIPDFRKTLSDAHVALLGELYTELIDRGYLHEKKVEQRITRLDNMDGDIDTLMGRMAHVRTWTYVTHKSEWLSGASKMQELARAIEDKLSDALHKALMRRFVDRRSSVLIKAMEGGAEMLAGIKKDGQVIVEGEEIGVLSGFIFRPDETARGADYRAVMKAARHALVPEIKRRVQRMIAAEDKQFTLTDKGEILYQAQATNPVPGEIVARLKKGEGAYKPAIGIVSEDLLGGEDAAAVQKRLEDWFAVHMVEILGALPKMDNMEDTQSASARGIGFQLHESFGVLPRENVQDLINELDDESRNALRVRKIRMAPVLIYMPLHVKPAAVRLKAMLWSLWNDKELPASVLPDGITSKSTEGFDQIDRDYYRAIGYPVYGPRFIRVDILDRVVGAIYDAADKGKFEAKHEMAEWLGCTIPDLYQVIEALGHKKIHDPADDLAKEEPAKAEAAEKQSSEAETPKAEENPPAEEAKAENVKAENVKAEDVNVENAKKEPAADRAPVIKPKLATFALKRGKAHEKPSAQSKKPFKKTDSKKKPNYKKDNKRGDKPKKPAAPRVISATSNPFDVLKDMQKK